MAAWLSTIKLGFSPITSKSTFSAICGILLQSIPGTLSCLRVCCKQLSAGLSPSHKREHRTNHRKRCGMTQRPSTSSMPSNYLLCANTAERRTACTRLYFFASYMASRYFKLCVFAFRLPLTQSRAVMTPSADSQVRYFRVTTFCSRFRLSGVICLRTGKLFTPQSSKDWSRDSSACHEIGSFAPRHAPGRVLGVQSVS